MPDSPFNPLDKLNLAKSLAEAMLQKPVSSLPPKHKFDGAGIYAIYYRGRFVPYSPLALKNRRKDPKAPIYVGKAVPPGARKGGFGLDVAARNALMKRLHEHARSIREATNLDIKDFSCRYLVCDDIWIPLGESLLIEELRPPWNVLIQGFGIHTPGSGRNKQVRSMWDTLHPGRSLAKRLPRNPISEKQLVKRLDDFFAGKKVPVLSPAEAVVEEVKEEETDQS
jgi:Eco29kI restriction endonuclease